MAYDKQTWTAREGTNLKKYTKASETATTVILTNTPDTITVAGTPFSVDRMNHMEDGIESAHENADALKITDPNVYYFPLSQTPRNWYGMTTLDNSIYACVYNGDIYKQTGGTGDFIALSQTPRLWSGMTTLGADVYACVSTGDIYKQTGGTGDFIALSQTPQNWYGMTTLGSDVYACVYNGDIYKQTGGTGDFIALSQTPRNWAGMTTLSSDVYACVSNGDIYKQTGGTGDFIALSQTSRNWAGMTTLGSDVYACVYNGDIYKQTPTQALEVYSLAETLTNQTYLGYPVYRKVINFGALPNATTKNIAHNISGTWRLFRLMGEAYNPTIGVRFQMSYSGLPAHLYIDNTNVAVLTTINASAWTSSYVTIEYIKAAL